MSRLLVSQATVSRAAILQIEVGFGIPPTTLKHTPFKQHHVCSEASQLEIPKVRNEPTVANSDYSNTNQ